MPDRADAGAMRLRHNARVHVLARYRRPAWLRTEIIRSADPLAASYDQCLTNARTLITFCRRLGLPFGINVESLTNRKVEIEASIELVRDISDRLR